MNHCMAVGADGPEVRDRVQFVLLPDLAERTEMVDVNEALPKIAVYRLEVEPADGARCAVVFKATPASRRVALIRVDDDLLLRTFDIRVGLGNLLRRALGSRLRRVVEPPTDLDRHLVLGDPDGVGNSCVGEGFTVCEPKEDMHWKLV